MEYVEGAGLREYLNRRVTFDFAQLVALMDQLLNALEFAHARGVVHRDIKPSNLIVTNQGVLKVADFGIARVDRTDLTMAGMLIGTPLYMSPEQCRGLDVDARSDLFSAGVVLYELLTGEKPFRGNMETITYKICHEDPEPPSRLSKLKLPAAVDQLIATALAKDPAARFQDAHAFRDSLRDVGQMSVEVEDGAGTTMMAIGTLRLQKPAPAWDDETLLTAERELARALGPMAKVIVHRAAAQASDRAELCSILSDSIIDPETRRNFVAAFERTAGSGVRADGVAFGLALGVAFGFAVAKRTRARRARRMPAARIRMARRWSRLTSIRSPRGSRCISARLPRSSPGRPPAKRRAGAISCGAWPTIWARRNARRFCTKSAWAAAEAKPPARARACRGLPLVSLVFLVDEAQRLMRGAQGVALLEPHGEQPIRGGEHRGSRRGGQSGGRLRRARRSTSSTSAPERSATRFRGRRWWRSPARGTRFRRRRPIRESRLCAREVRVEILAVAARRTSRAAAIPAARGADRARIAAAARART